MGDIPRSIRCHHGGSGPRMGDSRDTATASRRKTVGIRSQLGTPPAIDFKGAVFTLPVLHLYHADLEEVTAALERHLAKGLRFFDGAPVVLDLTAVRDAPLALVELVTRLRQLRLVPVGVRGGNADHHRLVRELGLAVLHGRQMPPSQEEDKPERPSEPVESRPPARVVEQPVRSGQQVYARGGDLVLLAPVNPGAEVVADGSIHAYAPLRGRALAGVRGDTAARIFTQCLEAELVAVAGHFRVFEDQLPEGVHRRPAQVYLEGDRLVVSALPGGGQK